MKKVLEGELLSIVHRVLQMKDTDVDKLYVEAKELYEKLQILKFYQDNLALGLVKDITEDQLVEKLGALTLAQTSEAETVTQTEIHGQEEEERSQIPTDLLSEDYPIVVEAEKEAVVDFEALPFDTAKEEVEQETETQANKEEEEEEMIDSTFASLNEEEIKEATEIEEEEEEATVDVQEEIFSASEIEEITTEEEIAAEENEWTEDEEEDEEDDWTEEDRLSIEEEDAADQVAAETANPAILEEVQEREEEEITFAPLTANQREDNPFEGFDFGEIEFIRVEDIAKEDTILVDDSMFESVVADTAATEEEENQPTANFFAQQTQDDAAKEVEEGKEESKGDNQQNMLFNLEQVSVREPRIVKKSINDIYRGTIMVGLNDRIAFEKHLFANSSEDFNRVLSQLNTVSTYDEARSFVEHLVKPEYNNWEGKEEYAERFMTLIEKRFE